MIGNREFLINMQPCSLEFVTFRDGGKGIILGSSSLKVPRTCSTTLINNLDIWHRRLGHISPRSLNETIAADVVLGILKI